MFIIVASWLQSLHLLSPGRLWLVLSEASKRFISSVVFVMKYFKLTFFVDICFSICCGDLVMQSMKLQVRSGQGPRGLVVAIIFCSYILHFIFETSRLLFIRKPAFVADNRIYLKEAFLRYIQLGLFFYPIFFMIIIFMAMSGITKIPHIPWGIKICCDVLFMITVFYWLNSSFFPRDAFFSVEKAINFLMYNLPLIVVWAFAVWCSNIALAALLFNAKTSARVGYLLFGDSFETLLTKAFLLLPVIKILLIKYIRLLCEGFWISVLFVLYSWNKNVQYSKSLFQRSDDSEE